MNNNNHHQYEYYVNYYTNRFAAIDSESWTNIVWNKHGVRLNLILVMPELSSWVSVNRKVFFGAFIQSIKENLGKL